MYEVGWTSLPRLLGLALPQLAGLGHLALISGLPVTKMAKVDWFTITFSINVECVCAVSYTLMLPLARILVSK